MPLGTGSLKRRRLTAEISSGLRMMNLMDDMKEMVEMAFVESRAAAAKQRQSESKIFSRWYMRVQCVRQDASASRGTRIHILTYPSYDVLAHSPRRGKLGGASSPRRSQGMHCL